MEKKKRGRPFGSKKTVVEESPKTDSLAVEETKTQAKARQFEEIQTQKKGLKYVGKEYYFLQPKLKATGKMDEKLIRVRFKNNGAKYQTFEGWSSKQKDFVQKLKKQGKLRNADGKEI